MTQPIQEPSTQRSLSQGRWGENQLFRRPAPVSTAASITNFRAFYEGGGPVGNDNEFQLNWNQWENENDAIFDEIVVTGVLTTVRFMEPGVYTTTVSIYWEDNFDTDIQILVLDPSGTSSNWPIGLEPNNSQAYNASEPGSQFIYAATYSVTKKYPIWGLGASDIIGGVYGSVLVKVLQKSGGSENLQAALLDIFYWGPSQTSFGGPLES